MANISQSLMDSMAGLRNVFATGSKKTEAQKTSNLNADTTTNSRKRVGGTTINNAFYTTISEGQQQPLKRGDGLANVFAKIYNLMKLEHDEDVKHRELEQDFAREKADEAKRKGLSLKDKKTPQTAVKEESKEHESFFKKMFGVLLKGVTGVISGVFNAITSTVGFLVSSIWKSIRMVVSLAGIIWRVVKPIGSVLTSVAGAVSGAVTFLAEKMFSMIESFSENIITRIIGFLEKRGVVGTGRLAAKAGGIGKLIDLFQQGKWGDFAAGVGLIGAGAIGGAIIGGGAGAIPGAMLALESIGYAAAGDEAIKEINEVIRYAYGDKYIELRDKFIQENMKMGNVDPRVLEKQEQEKIAARDEYQQKELAPILEKNGIKVSGKDKDGLIFTNEKGDRLGMEDFAYLYEKSKLLSFIGGKKEQMLSEIKDSEMYKKMQEGIQLGQGYYDYASGQFKSGLEGLKGVVSDVKSAGASALESVQAVTGHTGEALSNLFKEFGINKDTAQILPPVTSKETKVLPLPGRKKQHIMDYSIQMRTDDPTMISIHKQNLRPV
jgi:hypothetical protein